MSLKNNLAGKWCSLERQLREAEHTINSIDSDLKKSESKRFTLLKKLEEKKNDEFEKSMKLREQYGSSPRLGTRKDHSLISSEPINSESFQWSSYLSKMKNNLNEVCSKLSKYWSQSSYAFGFINILADVNSLKITCEKYIQLSCLLEKSFKDITEVRFGL